MKRGIPQLIDDPGMWLTNDINGYQRQEVDGKKVIEATDGFVTLVRRSEHNFFAVCLFSFMLQMTNRFISFILLFSFP